MNLIYEHDENLQIDRGQFVFIRMKYGRKNHLIDTISSPYDRHAQTYYMNENLWELKDAYVSEFLSKANKHIDRFDYKILLKHAFIGPMECHKKRRDLRCQLKLYLPRHFRDPAAF